MAQFSMDLDVHDYSKNGHCSATLTQHQPSNKHTCAHQWNLQVTKGYLADEYFQDRVSVNRRTSVTADLTMAGRTVNYCRVQVTC